MRLTRRFYVVLFGAASVVGAATAGLGVPAWSGSPAPAVRPAVSVLPACPAEDWSPVACRWDAARQGNGRGRSFTFLPGPDGSARLVFDDGSTELARP